MLLVHHSTNAFTLSFSKLIIAGFELWHWNEFAPEGSILVWGHTSGLSARRRTRGAAAAGAERLRGRHWTQQLSDTKHVPWPFKPNPRARALRRGSLGEVGVGGAGAHYGSE